MCFWEGHGFSRADKAAKNTGFSPSGKGSITRQGTYETPSRCATLRAE